MRIAEQYILLPQSLRYYYTTNIIPTTTHNKHFLSSFSVPRRTRERKIVNKYINHLIIKTIIIIIILILGTFPACVVCVSLVVCVLAGSRGLLKLSQPGRNWQAGKYWMVSEAERYWGTPCGKAAQPQPRSG